jgi:hypothetical protein
VEIESFPSWTGIRRSSEFVTFLTLLGISVLPVLLASRACVEELVVVFPRGLVAESLVLRRVFCAADNSAEVFL